MPLTFGVVKDTSLQANLASSHVCVCVLADLSSALERDREDGDGKFKMGIEVSSLIHS